MKVVDVLCDDIYVEPFLQFFENLMGTVRHSKAEIMTALVVEFMYESRIALEPVGAGHFHDRIFLPEASGIAECGYAAFGTDSGSGRYYKFRFHSSGMINPVQTHRSSAEKKMRLGSFF